MADMCDVKNIDSSVGFKHTAGLNIEACDVCPL